MDFTNFQGRTQEVTVYHRIVGVALAGAIAMLPSAIGAQTPASAAGGAPKYAGDLELVN
jgi:hypothetical protein